MSEIARDIVAEYDALVKKYKELEKTNLQYIKALERIEQLEDDQNLFKKEIGNLRNKREKTEKQLMIFLKYKVKEDINGDYFLSKGIYSIANFNRDFIKDIKELQKALEGK